MTHTNNDLTTSQRLLQFGMVLFFLGLVTGFMMPVFANPRMGLASHLEGVMNGLFLVSLGLIWTRLQLTVLLKRLVIVLVVFGTFSNWLATLLAALWGAGSMMSIAANGMTGSQWQESLISGLLLSLSAAMLVVVALLIYGLRPAYRHQASTRLATDNTP
jgi:hydroxylaminobenzene mutase